MVLVGFCRKGRGPKKMNKLSVFEKTAKKSFVLAIVFAVCFTMAASGQSSQGKKWTYDFSEKVKFFDTPLEACKSYSKEKYPSDNYKASIEATNDPETYRCSADGTYFGLVYKRECKPCASARISEGRVGGRNWHTEENLNRNG
jgi:hypothetical protein